MIERFHKRAILGSFRLALLMIIMIEAFSFWGFLLPQFSTVAAAIISLLVLVLAFVRFDWAVLVLLAELFVGSQGGYHLTFGLEEGLGLSLRMGLFMAVFIGWSARSLLAAWRRFRGQPNQGLAWLDSLRQSRLLWPYLALLAVFVWAGLNGWWHHGFSDTFFDANGYAYFLILPAIVSAFREALMAERTVGVMLAAVTAAVVKALFVFYVFSHRILHVASPLYVWVRDTRVGEITIMTGDFYRIFFQSHLFGLMVALVAAVMAGFALSWRHGRYWLSALIASGSAVALVLGLSRSFWFGAFMGALTIVVVLVWARTEAMVWKRLLSVAGMAVLLSVAVIAGTYAIPFPKKGAEFSLTGLLGGRATSFTDDAANSRWELLPKLNAEALKHPILGSGFGARVTYRTSDPRILADSPSGLYSTYSFEWGYHDLWLKLGLVGLAAYGWLLYRLLRPLVRTVAVNRKAYQRAELAVGQGKALVSLGLLAAVVALLATNVFSPYLNHPLGIGSLCLLAAWVSRDRFSEQD